MISETKNVRLSFRPTTPYPPDKESRPSTAPVFDDWTRQTMLRYHGHQGWLRCETLRHSKHSHQKFPKRAGFFVWENSGRLLLFCWLIFRRCKWDHCVWRIGHEILCKQTIPTYNLLKKDQEWRKGLSELSDLWDSCPHVATAGALELQKRLPCNKPSHPQLRWGWKSLSTPRLKDAALNDSVGTLLGKAPPWSRASKDLKLLEAPPCGKHGSFLANNRGQMKDDGLFLVKVLWMDVNGWSSFC